MELKAIQAGNHCLWEASHDRQTEWFIGGLSVNHPIQK